MKKTGAIVALIAVLIIAAGLGWLYYADYLDREKPIIKLDQDIVAIGRSKDIAVRFSDLASGLSNLKVELVQNNTKHLLAQETFPSRGIKEKNLQIKINTSDLQLKNGAATLHISATDYALIKNQAVWIQQVTIDTTPPNIEVLSTVNYINQGGTGFIAYRTSKPSAVSGVYVDEHFSRGHKIFINNKPMNVAYFAMPINATNANTKISIYARDEAGNDAKISLPCTIKPKKFRADKLNLSEAFLKQKMPEFQVMVPELQNKPLTDVFAYVNGQMREDNARTIQKICTQSSPKKLWDGAFLRMKNAKPMALFGDYRIYIVDNKPFGNSTHLGVDLASHAHAPIEAANHGVVVYSGPLGIYGNTVIIDHGLGLFSLYAHLSSLETAVGKTVKKGDQIGLSGLTGLAGGDHLHFSILINGQFVNPVEWWDVHWIKDNIEKKMAF
jgi:murein DD-endopeptidase MepM/ murein hydrolase activator NlpD